MVSLLSNPCRSWGCWDDPTYMTYSKSPNGKPPQFLLLLHSTHTSAHAGPFATPQIVLSPLPNGDTNLAGVISKDGRFVGIWREAAPMHWPNGSLRDGQWRSVLRSVIALDWKDLNFSMHQLLNAVADASAA